MATKTFDQYDADELKEITRKGGIASGEARREKKQMREACSVLLALRLAGGKQDKLENLKNFSEAGKKNLTVQEKMVANLMYKALNGDISAFKEIRDLSGQSFEAMRFEREVSLQANKCETNIYTGIPAVAIAPGFASVLFDITEHKYLEYVFPGGRGSTKSSFIGLNVVDLIMKHDNMHACVLRNVGNTIKDSVFSQILWAIDTLSLTDEFVSTKSPFEITRIKTGQKIFFRGADDPNKIKSIKPPFGYIGILWFEELDQFAGPEAVRKIEQSAIRGGDKAYKFKSFNPPKSAHNWANKYIKVPRTDRLVTESNYLSVPAKWLGKPFLDDAEFLKETNPLAYENEYMGVANGSGGAVFDNVKIREITDEEISHFDNILNGVDWGWYPDLFAFCRVQYQPAQHTLYIWQEYTCNKQKNLDTANKLKELGITANDILTCDSAENKSVEDYREYGLLARGAKKGPGSREYSYKWLQSLRAIVIDNKRCPEAAQEFLNYEYERDKEGNVISGYPDGNDHVIDAVRYSTERIWKRRGQ